MSDTAPKFVVSFQEIDKSDVKSVGGKAANLGEMTRSGFPVPRGFVVTVDAYDRFLADNNLASFINDYLNRIDVSDSKELAKAAVTIQRHVNKGKVDNQLAQSVINAYKKLSKSHALVAVRSSATAEDLPNASFAGQQATFLNIKGEANVMNAVRESWASLFTARSIFYRVQNKIKHERVKMAVVVQKMVQSDVSGVMFTINPVDNDKERIIIEAIWGLGELIVGGSVIPDRYVVQRDTFDILSKELAYQEVELVRRGNETRKQQVPQKNVKIRKLQDDEIVKLAKIGQKLQEHYYFPQDIEWARENGQLYIVQTRPITTIKAKTGSRQSDLVTANAPLLIGTPASPGIATGPVRVVKSPNQIDKVKSGDILVAPMTSPDFVPAMKRAVGIVTDEGGSTSHAAIVSRELGVACVVGTKEATSILKDGQIVTVHGKKGEVYLGSKVVKEEVKLAQHEKPMRINTATNLYVNLAEPDLAKKVSKLHVDGVGLLRAEFMIADIGVHPKEAIKRKKQNDFVKKLASGLRKFCKSFNPRPVVYRATDFKTNEYGMLDGGKRWEPEEPNPMLGYRGAFRYISDPEVFSLELEAIKQVREDYKNIWLMVPYVRSPEELARVKRLIAAEELLRSPSFKIWMMVELPVNVILLDEFIKVGIDGVSIGSNDLTMLLLGTDRDNDDVSRAFDERSPALKWSLKRVIRICNKHGITSSICGQAPSTYDDLVEFLVEQGITSISVNPDAVGRVREVIARTERRIVNRSTNS